MKWQKFTLTTTTAAVDLISSMLDEIGIEGIEIEDNVPLTEEETKGMFIDILPELPPDEGVAKVSFYVDDDRDIEDAWQRTEASASRARRDAQPSEETADTETDEASEIIREGRAAMRRIRHANDLIPDPALSAQIDSIENSCGQILSVLEQRPQLLSQLRTFLRYYLPTTLRLLEARAKLENDAGSPKAREVRARISQAVGEIDKAFRKQAEALDEYRFIDLESEMDVMRDMLKADGLIDEETGDDPFADVLKPRGGQKPMASP